MVNGMNDMNGGADMIRRFHESLRVLVRWRCWLHSLLRGRMKASTWLGLAANLCGASAEQPLHILAENGAGSIAI